jgi:hypothetical protein
MPEFIEATRLWDVQPDDAVDEGVYVIRIDDPGGLTVMPVSLVSEWIDEAGVCIFRDQYDGENVRTISEADFPLRVIRHAPPPPRRCYQDREPCDRCPRSTR